jgi:hypothetical protein
MDSFYSVNGEQENTFSNNIEINTDLTIRENEASKRMIFKSIDNKQVAQNYDIYGAASPALDNNFNGSTVKIKNTVCKIKKINLY